MTNPAQRNHGLDLMRGLAALGVATTHLAYWVYDVYLQSLATFGVYVFFILSSLTMMMVYGRDFSAAISLHDLRRFYWHRISRIMPLLAAVSIFTFALGHALLIHPNMASDAAKMFMTATWLFSLHMPGFLSNTNGAWSLGIEGAFYLLFPLVCLLAINCSQRALVIATVLLVAAQQILLFLLRDMASDELRHWHYYTSPLTFAPFFAMGLLIFKTEIIPTVQNIAIAGLLGLIIALFTLFVKVPLFTTHWAFLLLSALAFLTIFFAYHATVPRWLVGTSQFLGNASYSLYLTHGITFWFLSRAERAGIYGPLTKSLLYFPAALLVAHCCFRFFERPLQNALRSRLERPPR